MKLRRLGIRFALSSALAAASVLNTWRDPRLETGATEYYRHFMAQCLQRHLRFLQELTDDSEMPKQNRTFRSGVAEVLIENDSIANSSSGLCLGG
jgi:flavin-dependent dehydrogenase